ncbi:MAG: ABC transporter ATP-binding protein [Thermoplasmatota archaeon]
MDDVPLLEVEGLSKRFAIKSSVFGRDEGEVRAVDAVSFAVRQGETLGIVGESGCGKSTLGRLLVHLLEPSAGHIRFRGEDVARLRGKKLREFRREMQMVFQDPASSLNPRMTAGEIVVEPLVVHGLVKRREREEKAAELLGKVGLKKEHATRFPHEFSGGQKQRIGIARALALKPTFLVLDEPTSALDVSVQAQILNLLQDLQRDEGLTFIFITHALNVVQHIADRVAVMYLGKIVELGETEGMFARPNHPYTQALLSAAPLAPGRVGPARPSVRLRGEVPSPRNPPMGCTFHPRCPIARPACKIGGPALLGRAGEVLAKGKAPWMAALGEPRSWVMDRGSVLVKAPDASEADVDRVLRKLFAAEVGDSRKAWWAVTREEAGIRVRFEPLVDGASGVACHFSAIETAAAKASSPYAPPAAVRVRP